MTVAAPASDSPAADDRRPTRVVNEGPGPPEDGRERRWDVCPKCGGGRWEIVVIPDRFFCDKCQVASVGPNADVPEPEPVQLGLGLDPEPAGVDDGPPPDEGMAWIADEMPDE